MRRYKYTTERSEGLLKEEVASGGVTRGLVAKEGLLWKGGSGVYTQQKPEE